MPRAAVPGQRQIQAGRGRADEVGQVEDALPGPVVAVQPDDVQPGVVGDQLPQVRRVGAAEPVDGLRVVAHAGQLLPVRLQQPHDAGLDRVDVLVLVDQDRVEHAAQHRPGHRVGQRRLPQQQQVIEVQQVPGPLARGVGPEQPGQLPGERRTPRETGGHHLADRPPGVHAPGVDIRARRRPRRPLRREPGSARPWSGRSTSRMSTVSPGSKMVNCGGSENDSACCRMILCAMAWNVPPQIRSDRAAARPGRRAGEHVAGRAAGERQQQDPAGRARPGRRAATPPAPPASASCRCPPRPAPAAARPDASPPAAAVRSARPAHRFHRTCM